MWITIRFFGVFIGNQLMYPLFRWACLQISFHSSFITFFYFRVPSPIDCRATKIDDKRGTHMDECRNMDDVR